MRFRLRFWDFWVPDGRKIQQKSLQNQLKKSIDFCTHLGIVFLDFLCFSAPLGTRKTSKNDWGVPFFDFLVWRFEIDSNVFLDFFGRIFGSKVDPKSWKNHAKMVLKKRLDFNSIFWWFCADLGGHLGRLEAPFSRKIFWKIVSKFWWFFTSLRWERRHGLEAPQGSFFYTRI